MTVFIFSGGSAAWPLETAPVDPGVAAPPQVSQSSVDTWKLSAEFV